jgi:hypothetical protein
MHYEDLFFVSIYAPGVIFGGQPEPSAAIEEEPVVDDDYTVSGTRRVRGRI